MHRNQSCHCLSPSSPLSVNLSRQFRKCNAVADRGHGHGALHGACGKWQVAALAVPLSPLQLSLLPSLLLLLLLWHCLAIYQRTQTHTLRPPPRPRLYWSPLSHTATLGQIGDLLHCYFVVDVARFAAALFIYCLGDLNDSTDSAFAEVC